MPFCSSCGADVAGVKFCAKCGQPVEAEASDGAAPEAQEAPAAAPPNPGGGEAAAAAPIANKNVLGAVAYLTIIPAIIFLLIEPYNKDRFIRFHSLQCLVLGGGLLALNIVNIVVGFIPFVGWILSIVLSFVIFFGGLVAWIIAVVKAYNGEEYRLPFIGDFAAQHV